MAPVARATKESSARLGRWLGPIIIAGVVLASLSCASCRTQDIQIIVAVPAYRIPRWRQCHAQFRGQPTRARNRVRDRIFFRPD